FAYFSLGAYADAEVSLAAAVSGSESMGLLVAALNARMNLGRVCAYMGKLRQACAIAAEVGEAYRALGDRRSCGFALTYRALAVLLLDRAKEAEESALASLELVARVDWFLPLTWSILADARLALGDFGGGLESAKSGIERLERARGIVEGESRAR